MTHPALGRYGRPVLYGELAGTVGASIMNAVFSPITSAVLKTITGIWLGWYGLNRLDETGVTAYQAGVRLLTSVVEQLSYPRESRAMMEDAQSRRPFHLRLDEWKITTSAESATSAPTVARVVVSQTHVPQPTKAQKSPNTMEI